jgi:HNH endonuclease
VRGQSVEVGTQRTSANGYLYEKTPRGWILVHRLVAERKLGRLLTDNEYVTFADGDKTNFDPSNLIVRQRGTASIRARLARVEAQIASLEALRNELVQRLELRDVIASGNGSKVKQSLS